MTEPATYGPLPNPPRGVWRVVRTGVLLALGWSAVLFILAAAFLFALLTLRIGVRRYSHRIAHLVGYAALKLQGVRLAVTHYERVASREARIVFLNHTSQLDFFIIAALMPPGGAALVKRELLWVPVLGWCFWAFKFRTIDRKDLERAKASMKRVGEDLKQHRMSVFISPEGTRARDLRLQPFKKGAFHLAAETHAPIFPVLLRGAGECQPVGQLAADPGVVTVEFLPSIPTHDYTTDNVDQKSVELHDLYAGWLAHDSPGHPSQ